MKQFRTKICGITRVADAHCAFNAGADAIGLNFYRKSKRFVEPDDVAQWLAGFREMCDGDVDECPAPQIIGVFVNSQQNEMSDIAKALKLDGIQLHGDEDPSIVDGLRYGVSDDCYIIRAVRTQADESMIAQVKSEVNRWNLAGVDAILLDAATPGAYGGTGKKLDWNQLSQMEIPLPWILAGGLTPGNVGEAIAQTGANSVDVASGVESKPGIKDEAMVKKFVAESIAAMQQ